MVNISMEVQVSLKAEDEKKTVGAKVVGSTVSSQVPDVFSPEPAHKVAGSSSHISRPSDDQDISIILAQVGVDCISDTGWREVDPVYNFGSFDQRIYVESKYGRG